MYIRFCQLADFYTVKEISKPQAPLPIRAAAKESLGIANLIVIPFSPDLQAFFHQLLNVSLRGFQLLPQLTTLLFGPEASLMHCVNVAPNLSEGQFRLPGQM